MRIELPQVGESVTEATVVKWLRAPGETVKQYDPLVELETDKVVMEFPSPVAGILKAIVAQEGQTIPVGAALCEIEAKASATSTPPRSPSSEARPAPASTGISPTAGTLIQSNAAEGPTGVREEAAEPAQEPSEQASPHLSPLVRRIMAQHNLAERELLLLKGTGIGGRITKDDVLAYVQGRPQNGPVREKASVPSPSPAASPTSAPSPGPTPESGDEVVPLTHVRRLIAERMSKSAQVPTGWTSMEADLTALVAFRDRMRDDFKTTHGVELTLLPFVVKVVSEALREHPRLNSTWAGDRIILRRHISIGIAAATPAGLVVPVLKDADNLSIAGLAKAVNDLTTRARERRLTMQDVAGGTFTVNNTGALGCLLSQSLLNGDETAILNLEAVAKRPVVVHDAIAVRSMAYLSLTFDHRTIDGAEAAAFLRGVKRRLESFAEAPTL